MGRNAPQRRRGEWRWIPSDSNTSALPTELSKLPGETLRISGMYSWPCYCQLHATMPVYAQLASYLNRTRAFMAALGPSHAVPPTH